jgi:signal transduction histidine kinase
MVDGTILCVDDDPTVRSALRTVMSNLGTGYVVEIAENAEEALEIEAELRENGQSLMVVISDFIMPGMHGDALLAKLHQLSPETIKIMLTGQSAFEGVKRAINEANLYRFLEKPFDNDDFLLTVKSACLAFQQQQALTQKNLTLTRLNDELEKMLETLRNQRQELTRSEAKATISTLVASVSHELSTPLGNSLMTAEMMVDLAQSFQKTVELGLLKRSNLDEFLKSIKDGGNMLQKNLQRANGLLQNFKQVAADQASEQRRIFDLAHVVHEILATMAPSLRHEPHKVVIEIKPGVMLDSMPGALGQVVINLVNNAYLHAFEGRTDGVLTIRATSDGETVHMTFSDNGVGISEANLARLCEPFFSTKIGKGGTGLGMSIVENLVRKSLGGQLHLASTVGVGTVFTIDIPVQAPPAVSHLLCC